MVVDASSKGGSTVSAVVGVFSDFVDSRGSNYANNGSNYGHAVSPALSTGCTFSPRSAPPTSSGRLNDRDSAPPHRAGRQIGRRGANLQQTTTV